MIQALNPFDNKFKRLDEPVNVCTRPIDRVFRQSRMKFCHECKLSADSYCLIPLAIELQQIYV